MKLLTIFLGMILFGLFGLVISKHSKSNYHIQDASHCIKSSIDTQYCKVMIQGNEFCYYRDYSSAVSIDCSIFPRVIK